jgi:hypothetical protein
LKALRFIRDYWYIPFFMVGAFALMLLLSRRFKLSSAIQKIDTELSAIRAQRDARAISLELGAEQAKQHVLDKYAEQRKSLDEQMAARVKSLEQDPEQLAKCLERLTRAR